MFSAGYDSFSEEIYDESVDNEAMTPSSTYYNYYGDSSSSGYDSRSEEEVHDGFVDMYDYNYYGDSSSPGYCDSYSEEEGYDESMDNSTDDGGYYYDNESMESSYYKKRRNQKNK